MAFDANGGTTNFHVVPPLRRPGYMGPYDLYDMDETDEEETEEMTKDVLDWLQEQGYSRVLRHGHFVCPYCNLANRQWGFGDILQHASGISSGCTVKSRCRHHALEEYLHMDPSYATFRCALGMADRRVPYPST
jgi:hypothetical protein